MCLPPSKHGFVRAFVAINVSRLSGLTAREACQRLPFSRGNAR